MTGPLVEVTIGPVTQVQLNRPQRGNALTYPLVAELDARLHDVSARPDVRAVIISGAGQHFCVGGDLAGEAFSSSRRDIAMDEDVALQRRRSGLVETIRAAPQLVIAAIDGACVGAGFGIALACDVRVATTRAVFAAPFLELAVSGDYGTIWSLSHLLGDARARELILTPRRVDAAEALLLGIVSDVVDCRELNAAVTALAERAIVYAPHALAAAKQNFASAQTLTLDMYLNDESRRQVECARRDEAIDAARSRLASLRSVPTRWDHAEPD